MGIYIKIDNDNVILGSQVPQEGYVWYEGEVPQYDAETQILKWINNTIVVIDKDDIIYDENGYRIKTPEEKLAELKIKKLKDISNKFNEVLANGHFFSQTLQIEVDCRRSSTKNDLQNVENIIEFLTLTNRQGLDMYRGYTDPKTGETQYAYNVTLSQLQQVKLEMIQYGLQLYNRKWQLEDAIANAQTQSELDAITIDFDNL